jgi:hypothetical protein
VHGAAPAAAVRRKGITNQWLCAVNASRYRRQRLPRRSIAEDWLGGGHGVSECWWCAG